jgi:hypothetical protein
MKKYFTKLLLLSRINPVYIAILSIVFLGIDYISGPKILFPIFLVIPVAMAAWYNSIFQGILFSIVNIIITSLFPYLWSGEREVFLIIINSLIRLFIFLLLVIILNKTSLYTRSLMKRVNTLEGILPICSHCKKICDKDNNWRMLEEYISKHSEVSFSHGLCPECARKYYQDEI